MPNGHRHLRFGFKQCINQAWFVKACNPSEQEVEEAGLKFKGIREAYVLMCFTARSRQDRTGEQPEISNILLLSRKPELHPLSQGQL